ncbi:Zinc finger and BTB domain-containing protein 24 [Acipenser ruthenus]|uniref:Zinc finger and BTB domain-containing protein 24 n=1 Tax=Acipenser ruthenus TaxID=7906 RepID=A0A444UZJ9_ACIRT|nr:Zinc finger and BTB domain-containing protein 24 [Acipenser ruthenus]
MLTYARSDKHGKGSLFLLFAACEHVDRRHSQQQLAEQGRRGPQQPEEALQVLQMRACLQYPGQAGAARPEGPRRGAQAQLLGLPAELRGPGRALHTPATRPRDPQTTQVPAVRQDLRPALQPAGAQEDPRGLNRRSRCRQRLRSAARLAIHRRRLHARQEEKEEEEEEATPESKALACTLCDRVFRHSSTLSHHKSRHLRQELRCSVCTHDLANSGSLQLRVRLHHTGGKRPYHCLVCSRTFCAMLTFLRHCEKHQQQDKEGQGARSAK